MIDVKKWDSVLTLLRGSGFLNLDPRPPSHEAFFGEPRAETLAKDHFLVITSFFGRK